MKFIDIMTYNPTYRISHPVWGFSHINNLIRLSFAYYDPTSVLYACFEARNLFEQIDYFLALVTVPIEQENECIKRAKELTGGMRPHTNHYMVFIEKYIQLYPDLSRHLCLPIPKEDYKITSSHSFRERLNDYLHLYDKIEADFRWGSPFIGGAIDLCNEILNYISTTNIISDFGVLQLGNILNISPQSSVFFENFKIGNIDGEHFTKELEENNWIDTCKADIQNYFKEFAK